MKKEKEKVIVPRPKKDQDVYYKSFRYTSENDLYLNEFLSSLDNANRFILSIIKGSKRYKNYLDRVEDDAFLISLGGLDDTPSFSVNGNLLKEEM